MIIDDPEGHVRHSLLERFFLSSFVSYVYSYVTEVYGIFLIFYGSSIHQLDNYITLEASNTVNNKIYRHLIELMIIADINRTVEMPQMVCLCIEDDSQVS